MARQPTFFPRAPAQLQLTTSLALRARAARAAACRLQLQHDVRGTFLFVLDLFKGVIFMQES